MATCEISYHKAHTPERAKFEQETQGQNFCVVPRKLLKDSSSLPIRVGILFELILFFSHQTGGICPIPMDTTFIIGSSAIACSDRNWIRLLNFVQILVRAFGASESGSHFALIPYSTDPELVLKFNSLTSSQLTVSEVNRQVARLRCKRGFNRIDKALELADKEVLTYPAGMRDVSRVK